MVPHAVPPRDHAVGGQRVAVLCAAVYVLGEVVLDLLLHAALIEPKLLDPYLCCHSPGKSKSR